MSAEYPFEFPIHITVNQTRVEGIGLVSSCAVLEVRITKPYQGLSIDKQLTFFSRLPDRQVFGDNAITHEYAERFLTQLFLGAQHALSNPFRAEQALKTIAWHRKELSKPSDRPRLKRLFKTGELKQSEYQLLINKHQNDRSKLHRRQRQIEGSFIYELFGDLACTGYPNGWESFLKEHLASRLTATPD